MGYSKKLYNVLGGVTHIIIPRVYSFAYPQKSQILQFTHSNFVHIYQIQLVNIYKGQVHPALF